MIQRILSKQAKTIELLYGFEPFEKVMEEADGCGGVLEGLADEKGLIQFTQRC